VSPQARPTPAGPFVPTVPDLAQIFEPVHDELKRVEGEFARYLESRVELIPEMGRYVQTSGGKRVRPAVLLMSARLCGYTGDRAVLNAAVVEFIHTATLVHDDIIDGAKTRRGQLAAHSRWGSDITVLLGDYLYIRSMAMALMQDSLDVVRLLCDCTLKMIEGELYQLTKTGDASITETEHFEIIRRKTAHLFAGCAEIGGLLGDATADQRVALREYGFNLGVAFQIVDDVLDYVADVADLIASVVADGQITADQWRTIKDLLARHGAVEAAFGRAVTHATRAKQCLTDAFGPSPERDSLVSLVDYLLNRDR
jgi:octaprenyl-diphosphate synthase